MSSRFCFIRKGEWTRRQAGDGPPIVGIGTSLRGNTRFLLAEISRFFRGREKTEIVCKNKCCTDEEAQRDFG